MSSSSQKKSGPAGPARVRPGKERARSSGKPFDRESKGRSKFVPSSSATTDSRGWGPNKCKRGRLDPYGIDINADDIKACLEFLPKNLAARPEVYALLWKCGTLFVADARVWPAIVAYKRPGDAAVPPVDDGAYSPSTATALRVLRGQADLWRDDAVQRSLSVAVINEFVVQLDALLGLVEQGIQAADTPKALSIAFARSAMGLLFWSLDQEAALSSERTLDMRSMLDALPPAGLQAAAGPPIHPVPKIERSTRRLAISKPASHPFLKGGARYIVPIAYSGHPAPAGMEIDYRARVDGEDRFRIPQRLDPEEMAVLILCCPLIPLQFTGTQENPHGFLAALRILIEEYCYRKFDGPVTDIGGNALRHARFRQDVFSIAPTIFDVDIQRKTKWQEALTTDPSLSLNYCEHTLQTCDCPVTAGAMAIDSLYYISPEDMLVAVRKYGRVLAAVHRFPGSDGVKWRTDRYERDSAGNVSYHIPGAEAVYQHSAMDWLDSGYFEMHGVAMSWTKDLTTPIDYNVYVFHPCAPYLNPRTTVRSWSSMDHYGEIDNRFCSSWGQLICQPDFGRFKLRSWNSSLWRQLVSAFGYEAVQEMPPVCRAWSVGAAIVVGLGLADQAIEVTLPKAVIAKLTLALSGRKRDSETLANAIRMAKQDCVAVNRSPLAIQHAPLLCALIAFCDVRTELSALRILDSHRPDFEEMNRLIDQRPVEKPRKQWAWVWPLVLVLWLSYVSGEYWLPYAPMLLSMLFSFVSSFHFFPVLLFAFVVTAPLVYGVATASLFEVPPGFSMFEAKHSQWRNKRVVHCEQIRPFWEDERRYLGWYIRREGWVQMSWLAIVKWGWVFCLCVTCLFCFLGLLTSLAAAVEGAEGSVFSLWLFVLAWFFWIPYCLRRARIPELHELSGQFEPALYIAIGLVCSSVFAWSCGSVPFMVLAILVSIYGSINVIWPLGCVDRFPAHYYVEHTIHRDEGGEPGTPVARRITMEPETYYGDVWSYSASFPWDRDELAGILASWTAAMFGKLIWQYRAICLFTPIIEEIVKMSIEWAATTCLPTEYVGFGCLVFPFFEFGLRFWNFGFGMQYLFPVLVHVVISQTGLGHWFPTYIARVLQHMLYNATVLAARESRPEHRMEYAACLRYEEASIPTYCPWELLPAVPEEILGPIGVDSMSPEGLFFQHDALDRYCRPGVGAYLRGIGLAQYAPVAMRSCGHNHAVCIRRRIMCPAVEPEHMAYLAFFDFCRRTGWTAFLDRDMAPLIEHEADFARYIAKFPKLTRNKLTRARDTVALTPLQPKDQHRVIFNKTDEKLCGKARSIWSRDVLFVKARAICMDESRRWHSVVGPWATEVEHLFMAEVRALADLDVYVLAEVLRQRMISGRSCYVTKGLTPNQKGNLLHAGRLAIPGAGAYYADGLSFDRHHRHHLRVLCVMFCLEMGLPDEICFWLMEQTVELHGRTRTGIRFKAGGCMYSGETITALFHCWINGLSTDYLFMLARLGLRLEHSAPLDLQTSKEIGAWVLSEARGWFAPGGNHPDGFFVGVREWIIFVDGDDNYALLAPAFYRRIKEGRAVMVEHFAMLGLDVVLNFQDDPLLADYCSGFFWPATVRLFETYIHGPIIGRALIKSGWSLERYNSRRAQQWLFSVFKPAYDDWRHIPVLRAVARAVMRLVPRSKKIAFKGENPDKRHVSESGIANWATWSFMEARYGLSQTDILHCENVIDSISRLPVLLDHYVIDAIMAVDYPEVA